MKKTYTVLASIIALVLASTAVSGWYWFNIGFLDNAWWQWFLFTYTMTLLAVLGAVVFMLRIAAILNPNVPTNKIVDLLKETFGTTGEFPKLPVR